MLAFVTLEYSVNDAVPYAALRERYRKAAAEAAFKQDLVRSVAAKGPQAIRAATDTARKAAKRRDDLAAQLASLGVEV